MTDPPPAGPPPLPPLPEGVPESAVAAFFDEYGSANIDAVRAGLTGWERERYAITAGLAVALQRIGCGSLYAGPLCPCYQAGLIDADCTCR